MAWGLRRRYYCVNLAHCALAREDFAYSEQQHLGARGLCAGHDGSGGCGSLLREGSPRDLRPKWTAAAAAAMVVLGIGGYFVRDLVFPSALTGVAFVVEQSRTEGVAALLSIDVHRKAGVDRRAVVDFESIDGSARAGTDYEPVRGRLSFEPGEKSKALSITILPDGARMAGERHFSVRLRNVAGTPTHVVFIREPQVDRSQQVQAEQMVRAASVVAKDIADHVVRLRVIHELLAASRADAGAFGRYQQALQATQGNLSRARESYAQFFRDLSSMPPRAVMQAMDAVSANLDRQGFRQQSQATSIMKKQYGEFSSGKGLSMDRWAVELAGVVPQARTGKPDAST